MKRMLKSSGLLHVIQMLRTASTPVDVLDALFARKTLRIRVVQAVRMSTWPDLMSFASLNSLATLVWPALLTMVTSLSPLASLLVLTKVLVLVLLLSSISTCWSGVSTGSTRSPWPMTCSVQLSRFMSSAKGKVGESGRTWSAEIRLWRR